MPPNATPQPAYLIHNVTLVDGTGRPPVAGASVAIENGRISWLGPEASAPCFPEHAVVDGMGGTLLPGLINSHVHLCANGSADFAAQVRGDSIPMATMRATTMAALTLRSGVTSVRDCGAADSIVIELARAVESGLIDGPRIVAAGRVITMTGGHGHFIGRQADGRDAICHATRAELHEGADFIKVMATGGVLTAGVDPANTALLQEELEVVAREAHNAGRRVATHAIGTEGIANALRAGIDSIEHGLRLDDATLQLAIDRGAYLVPTLLAVARIVETGVSGGVPDWVVAKAERESDHSRESFIAAVKSGMKIAAGTDAGTPFNPHGDLADELRLMVEYGLSPMQAIVAATRNAAENADILHKVGTIALDKQADLIIVDGDPVTDIAALRRVTFVAKGGRIYRNDLALPAKSDGQRLGRQSCRS